MIQLTRSSIDPVDDEYDNRPSFSKSSATQKSTFKPMPFVRAGESLPPPPPPSQPISVPRNMDDSDDEEDVK
jgi:hypothetical protein